MTYFLLKSSTCTIGWFFKIKIITWKHYQTCFCSESFIPPPSLCNFKFSSPLLLSPAYFWKICLPHFEQIFKNFIPPYSEKDGGRGEKKLCSLLHILSFVVYFFEESHETCTVQWIATKTISINFWCRLWLWQSAEHLCCVSIFPALYGNADFPFPDSFFL